MERDLKQFTLAVETFVNAKTDKELQAVFQFLPEKRQDYHSRFDEMFINSDDNLFFILTTNLAEWVNEIQDKHSNTSSVLNDFWELFEFVSDDITVAEKADVIEKAKVLLVELRQ